jgi:hypothetical protein
MAAMTIAIGCATTAIASPLDFTGWTTAGQSNDQGVWVKGSNANPYTIHTRSFFYDGSLAGSGFNLGDVIVAIGASGLTGTSSFGNAGWKFQMAGFDSANTWAAGTVESSTPGKSSFSGLGAAGAGSFTLQNITLLTVMQPNGTAVNNSANRTGIPSFGLLGTDSMQMFLNLSTIREYSVAAGTGAIPEFGSEVKTAFYANDGTLAEVLVNIQIVSQVIPGSGLAAIGTLGLAGVARRRRR